MHALQHARVDALIMQASTPVFLHSTMQTSEPAQGGAVDSLKGKVVVQIYSAFRVYGGFPGK